MPTILGIESTCDETGAAVVVDGRSVRSNVVATQVELHAKDLKRLLRAGLPQVLQPLGLVLCPRPPRCQVQHDEDDQRDPEEGRTVAIGAAAG